MREPKIGDVYKWDYDDGTIIGEVTYVDKYKSKDYMVECDVLHADGVYAEAYEMGDNTTDYIDAYEGVYCPHYNTELYKVLNP